MNYFMGIDVGTYSSKGVLIDEMCRIVAEHQISHGLENPAPGYFEHDAEKIWWGEVCAISRYLIAHSGIPAYAITGLGISALGCDVVPVDEACNALCNAILYGIDARAVSEMKYITEYYGPKRMKELLGREFCSSDCMPKILWLKNNKPQIYQKAAKFLTASSFITAKLTDNYVIDQFLAINSFAPAYREDFSIREEICRELYCRPDQLAKITRTTDIVGTVTPKAAAQTGLSAGTPVVTGTDDSGAEAISAGVLEPGDMMIQLGSTCYLIYCSHRPISDSRLWSSSYLVPDTYCIDGGTNAAGALTKWIRDTMYQDLTALEESGGENAYGLMAQRAARIPAGSDGLVMLPYFAGERTPIHDPQARGIIYGLLLHHTRDHIYRSALEAVAYAIAQHTQILEDCGLPIRNLICTGGGAQNQAWLQIIADVTGYPIQKPKITIGASYGDAMIAAVGTGFVKDFRTLHHYISVEKEYLPNLQNQKLYDTGRKLYQDLYKNNVQLMHKTF